MPSHIVYFRPLVTVSFLAKDVDAKQRVKLFTAIERFIFITFRLSRAFATYRNSEFYKAARQFRNKELSVDNIIEKLNSNMDKWIFYNVDESNEIFFDYEYFKKYLEKQFKNGGGYYYWNGLRYFLYEYEMDKVRSRGSQKIDWKLLS